MVSVVKFVGRAAAIAGLLRLPTGCGQVPPNPVLVQPERAGGHVVSQGGAKLVGKAKGPARSTEDLRLSLD
ncbi:MAG: hypothetical protein VKS61_11535 [Candidatus Sericytochromatia bacterium]|nr:hypothetical protein [Candidatus Sericytochromatia bacterium]